MSESELVLTDVVSAKQGTKIGILALNQPKTLNSLDLDMVDAITRVLQGWEADEEIGLVILKSANDRAFCAGGDIRKLYECAHEAGDHQDYSYADNFFEREYRLDYMIHTYAKPFLCWSKGVTFGGGLGLFTAASNSVGTEKTSLAMPEISIGLFPDAGGSTILANLERHFALMLGLTGARMTAGDATSTNICDHNLASSAYNEVLIALQSETWRGDKDMLVDKLDRLLINYDVSGGGYDLPSRSFDMYCNDDVLKVLADKQGHVEVVETLLSLKGKGSSWLDTSLEFLRAGCPLTAAIVVEQIKRVPEMTLEERFRLEMNVAAHCVRGADFVEGVRALIIDKDGKPKWSHSDVREVTDAEVQKHFEPLWDVHPLADFSR